MFLNQHIKIPLEAATSGGFCFFGGIHEQAPEVKGEKPFRAYAHPGSAAGLLINLHLRPEENKSK